MATVRGAVVARGPLLGVIVNLAGGLGAPGCALVARSRGLRPNLGLELRRDCWSRWPAMRVSRWRPAGCAYVARSRGLRPDFGLVLWT